MCSGISCKCCAECPSASENHCLENTSTGSSAITAFSRMLVLVRKHHENNQTGSWQPLDPKRNPVNKWHERKEQEKPKGVGLGFLMCWRRVKLSAYWKPQLCQTRPIVTPNPEHQALYQPGHSQTHSSARWRERKAWIEKFLEGTSFVLSTTLRSVLWSQRKTQPGTESYWAKSRCV